jgi:pimeloyl-ACP methyl ester carboxylesterase
MPWAGSGAFEPKLSRLVSRIDTYRQQGHEVSLVGASAGASAVLNAYVQRKDDIQGVVYICGKINRPDTVSNGTYRHNPAFKTSLSKLQDTVGQLSAQDKRKLHSFYSPVDTTVPHADTIIESVPEQKLPALGHMWAILYALSFGSGKLLRSLE